MKTNWKKASSNKKKKEPAQGIIEFALVMPVLLLVVYGLLETGRLLFIFGSVNTASRQAVRYGSASGLVDTDGNETIDTPRYEDCSGITAAANNVAFIASFTTINITYDRGLNPDGSIKPIDDINPDPSEASTCADLEPGTVRERDRIKVHVSAQFSPIISLIPLDPITIESAASRTIIGEITIFVTAVGAGWPGSAGSGTPSLVTTLDTGFPIVFDQPGDVVHFIYTLTNIEADDLVGPYFITEFYLTGVSTDCSGATSPLGDGETTTCTGTYTVTQADIDAGSITSLTVATTALATSNEDYLNINIDQNHDLDLQKSGSPAVALSAGETISFTYTLNNDGNTTLNGPFSISDDKVNSVDCSSATDPLLPGASTSCSGSYTITVADISNNSVTNYAIAISNEDVSDTKSFTVITNPLYLTVTADPTTASSVGELIAFTYKLNNVGITNLQSPYGVTASHLGTLDSGCSTSPIPPGGFMQCTSQYQVTQADIDAGFIANVATATAKLDNDTVTSNEATISVLLIQNPDLEITSIDTNPVSPVTVEGTEITYTYTLQNNGNVSLANLSIDDDLYGNIPCTGATDPLPPGASTTCSPTTPVTHVVSASDIADGSIINTASATATVGSGASTTTSIEASATIITYDDPRITFELTVNQVGASPGEIITYTYKIRNTGNTAFSGFTLTEFENPGVTFITECISAPIAIGDYVSCSANYTITAADEAAGSVTATWEAGAPEATLASSSTVTVDTYICIVSISNILTSGDSFYATITSNASLTVSAISVTWNNDRGHQTGADKTVRLIQISVDSPSSSFGVSPSHGGATYIAPETYTPTIQDGSNVIFTFHQSYDNQEATDQINITFSNPNCSPLGATP